MLVGGKNGPKRETCLATMVSGLKIPYCIPLLRAGVAADQGQIDLWVEATLNSRSTEAPAALKTVKLPIILMT